MIIIIIKNIKAASSSADRYLSGAVSPVHLHGPGHSLLVCVTRPCLLFTILPLVVIQITRFARGLNRRIEGNLNCWTLYKTRKH